MTLKAPDISTYLFQGVLVYDGSGYYPGLELLNLLYGCHQGLLPVETEVTFTKVTHEFARRLVWDPDFEEHPKRKDVLDNQSDTEFALRRLLECLQLEIPSSNQRPNWERAHFFPYTRSLIHWDARRRSRASQSINTERRYLRGGGALAHKVLRSDEDQERLNKNRKGFSKLYPEGDSSLERLSNELASHGRKETNPTEDQIEKASEVLRNYELNELYRDGIANILSHEDLSTVTRVRAVINWTGFWLITSQLDLAGKYVEYNHGFQIICDCGSSHPQLRRASQRCLKEAQNIILNAVEKACIEKNDELPKAGKNSIRSFFWATAATINLLNAWRGRRHFTLGLDILETLVLAACPNSSEMSYDEFLDGWLFSKCKLVVGRSSAEASGLLKVLDSSIFESNEEQLAIQMEAAGLVTQYSDATRMVSTGGMK